MPNLDDTTTDSGGQDGGSGGTPPPTWDSVLESLGEEQRALYDQHITGLRNTVQATRQERDALKQRVDAVVGALDGKDPSEVKRQLTELQSQFETANQRAAFFEDAGKPETGCRNPRLAWIVAEAEGLFDRRGNPDWDAIKQAAPELFGASVPPGNAGTGTSNLPSAKPDMNKWIRRQAGRE